MEKVRPITYLTNHAAELVREVAEGGGPVVITQHGEAKVVIVDKEMHDRWRQALAMLKLIALGEADITAGRTVSQDEVFERARARAQLTDDDA